MLCLEAFASSFQGFHEYKMALIDVNKQLSVNERYEMNSKTNSRLLLLHV